MKSLLTIRSLGEADLRGLIDEASSIRDRKESGGSIETTLQGLCVANLFFEPSTRTRLSFDLAAQRLGAHVITLDPGTSSASKGESLRDTVITVSSIGADVLIVRHSRPGVPEAVAEWTGLAVVNAGDGANEHPTQALLDAVTIRRRFGILEGLRMGVVGDIAHSRVAGSLVQAMPILGVELTLVGPEEWLPAGTGLATTRDFDDALPELDIVYLLRVQTERGGVITDDLVARYQLDSARAARLGSDAVIMHPGPINRGVEIGDEVAESARSLIVEQVRNAVPTRMAVLDALMRGRL
ncbi:MAG: aspartate carbamoyltransferase catalytic subunit [Acidimicrobiia bacterium]